MTRFSPRPVYNDGVIEKAQGRCVPTDAADKPRGPGPVEAAARSRRDKNGMPTFDNRINDKTSAARSRRDQ